jgi:hypothetical protein
MQNSITGLVSVGRLGSGKVWCKRAASFTPDQAGRPRVGPKGALLVSYTCMYHKFMYMCICIRLVCMYIDYPSTRFTPLRQGSVPYWFGILSSPVGFSQIPVRKQPCCKELAVGQLQAPVRILPTPDPWPPLGDLCQDRLEQRRALVFQVQCRQSLHQRSID